MTRAECEHQLKRWEDQREIKNLMGRLSSDYVVKRDKDMFEKYWSQEAGDVCLGVNNGYYTGPRDIRGYYAARDERIMFESRLIQRAFPKELGEVEDDALRGVGMIDYKPIDTAVIELAGDGQTAKGLWCIRGSHSVLKEEGPVAYWEFGWFAVDFLREGDDWRIWHLLYLDDICHPCGTSWAEVPAEQPKRAEYAEISTFRMPEPTIPVTLRQLYSVDRAFTMSPRMPEPYDTFSHTFSYGLPEGELKHA